MQWFKNLHAMPKLLLSFGLLLAISGLIGYESMSRMEESNANFDILYQKHLAGLKETADLRKDKLQCGRYVRNAIIDVHDPAHFEQSLESFEASLSDLNSRLVSLDKVITTPEGQSKLALIRSVTPQWAQKNRDVFALAKQGKTDEAIQALRANDGASNQIDEAAQRMVDIKMEVTGKMWEETHRAYQQARISMIALILGAIVIGIALALWIAKQFSRPLAETVSILRKVAAGDLTRRLEIDTKEEVGQMAEALNEALNNLSSLLEEVSASSINVSSASQQLAATAENFAAGSQEQAASLEETSASLEQITAAVRQNADNAKEANVLAGTSRDAAEQGGSVVTHAISAMAEINASSAKISDIITAIDEIAFQTNLLAVNAAVEAARAGEQGRGFAVVASEVRNLAQRSAGAAKEIKTLIQDSLRKVERGTDLVNRSGETLQGIVSSVKHVTDIVGEIAAASAEQSSGIDQVNTAMTQMDRVTQSNATQTEELSSTAQALSDQSSRLLLLVQRFTISNSSKIGNELRSALTRKPVPAAPAIRRTASSRKAETALSNGNGHRNGKSDTSLTATAVLEATDADFEQF